MKKWTSLLLAAVVVLAFNSCDKIPKDISFGYNIKSSFELPPHSIVDVPFNLPELPLSFKASDQFQSNGTNADLIKSIKLSHFKINLMEPVGEDLSFLKSMEIYINKEGLGEKKMAWKDNIADGDTSVNLDITPDDLSGYLKSDNFKLRVTVTFDEVTTTAHKIGFDIRPTVTATLLK